MRRNEDTFIKWKREGLLNSKIAYLRGASSNFYSQKKMAHDLGISEATFISLKNNHKEIRDALAYGDELLKADVMSALKKKAVGFVSTTKVRSMKKDGGGRNYQAIQEVEKEFPPDVEAIKYLLTVKFGREFHPKKEELEIMENKGQPELWMDINDDELTEASNIIRQARYDKIKAKASQIKQRKKEK